MSITLDQVTKRYQGSPVVNDVSLEVGEGEFFVLLGPSGSGKSTLLRAIAGLTGVDHGRIALHGNDVTHVSARQRGVGLVFQNYALFRHMTVGENIEFALKVRRMKAAERRERRKELLRLVALEGMDDRLPTQLSGGQQQRVAVARALAHKPPVLLLDEPFGALDAKIREELRRTIRQVQRELKITTVLVTHDQEEAFAMADRIGVMNLGRLLECGDPHELYARPATRFVATFLGAANLLLARQTEHGIRFGAMPVSARRAEKLDGAREQEVVAVLRPEEVELAPTRDNLRNNFIATGVVDEMVFTGALERIRVRMSDGAATAQIATTNGENGAPVLDITRTQHEQRAFPVVIGQSVAIGVRRIHVLPTPLSSYTAYASDAASVDRLSQHSLLVELANRMKTRIVKRHEPALVACEAPATAPVSGVAVIGSGQNTAQQLQWLLQNGAGEVLLLPTISSSPQRVLIHWTDDSARRSTLAVAASLLRHVAAEAVYVGILPESTGGESQRPFGVRTLLDARSEAQAVHGLEMRTELRFGAAAEELQRQLSEAPDQMLILGISDPGQLRHTFSSMFAQAAPYPMMIVYRPSKEGEGAGE
jgi:sulfate/thiosulfate transport system ATP-binding protein